MEGERHEHNVVETSGGRRATISAAGGKRDECYQFAIAHIFAFNDNRAVQNLTVYGRVPPQMTPSAGVYTDTGHDHAVCLAVVTDHKFLGGAVQLAFQAGLECRTATIDEGDQRRQGHSRTAQDGWG
ncbi:spore coat protein U domain-containing protein [Mesorhizobium sp. M1396]|uniref:spore coat protein U domain-containing protein n=1 Tax=unclassified Mesorhizobium TaxID=325217 RepID=UPI0033358CEC